MRTIRWAVWIVVAAGASMAAVTGASMAAAADGIGTPPPDLLEGTPEHFTRFSIEGHERHAQWLNRYLWYHFTSRGGNGPVLFNKEYLATADLWLNGAMAAGPGGERSIQLVNRRNLLRIEMDPEGYVHTHQHFSHAHDAGWPFPVWPQSKNTGGGPAIGWHFQPLEQVPGWAGDMLRGVGAAEYAGEAAASAWTAEGLEPEGIVDNAWRLTADGTHPSIVSPPLNIDPFHAPFLQIRYRRSADPEPMCAAFVEWTRDGEDFSPARRVYFSYDDESGRRGYSHSLVRMHHHPRWKGNITQLRIAFAPGDPGRTFDIDSIFTVYDTRHTINNPILVLSSWMYFRWTQDIEFLKRQVNRMRLALKYQQTTMGGLEHRHIRNPWVSHDGKPGLEIAEDGEKVILHGQGIGNNYWDLMPFGGDDMYATAQYYAATLAMADAEQAIRMNPGWDAPLGALAMDPAFLREHAAAVKEKANDLFWNGETGRFYAAIDGAGNAYDYGYTFLNLDAIWYGIASDEHADSIMAWISGRRVVEGDTSTGDDIYRWRFGPRATTKRNVDYYGWMWSAPESIPWGGQVQDGGAVLGFSFYDLWARLHVYGPDDAWARLQEILDWEREVWAEGGYRPYYEGGKHGTTLQGGGTAGGLGIDHEFYESSLIPAIVSLGFLGLEPAPAALRVNPQLPSDVPAITVHNLQYKGARLTLRATADEIVVEAMQKPIRPVSIQVGDGPKQKLADVGVLRLSY